MLSKQDRRRVRSAVEKAEAKAAVEIVPCICTQSSSYPEALWAGAAAAAGLTYGALLMAERSHLFWMPLSTSTLFVLTTALAGAALGLWVPTVRRLLIGPHHMEQAVARRAKEVFFDRDIARTRTRDGVLIFVSLLERRAIILVDDGIRVKVQPEAWQPAIMALVAAARKGRVADGLIAAIEETTRALRAAGLAGHGGGELAADAIEEDVR